MNNWCMFTFLSLLVCDKETVVEKHCEFDGFPSVLKSVLFQTHALNKTLNFIY